MSGKERKVITIDSSIFTVVEKKKHVDKQAHEIIYYCK